MKTEESLKKDSHTGRDVNTYSLHGINHIMSSSSKLFKVCWICLLFAATSAFGIHLYSLIRSYLKYEYFEKVEHDAKGTLVFPHVTICDTQGPSDAMLVRGDKASLLAVMRVWQQAQKVASMLKDPDMKNLYSYLLQTKRGHISNIGPNLTRAFGLKPSDFIVSCRFFENECSFEDFHLYQHPSYYNCYIFKGIRENSKRKPVQNYNNIGPDNGLSLVLVSQDQTGNPFYDNISKTENTKSFKLSIHEPGTDPDISDSGFDILPGISTSVALQQKEYHRLSKPYSDCTKKYNVSVGGQNLSVNAPLCFKLCLAEHVLNACQCVSFGINVYLLEWFSDTHKPCLFVNVSDMELTEQRALCEILFIRNVTYSPNFSESYMKCNCSWNCLELEYDISISQAKWPQKNLIPHFVDIFIRNSKSVVVQNTFREITKHYLNMSTSDTESGYPATSILRAVFNGSFDLDNTSVVEKMLRTPFTISVEPSVLNQDNFQEAVTYWVEGSFSRVNVYFKKGIVEKHEQVVAFGVVDFWSSVGGIAGLWIGASLLSIVEFLSFLIHTVSAVSLKLKGVLKISVQPVDNGSKQ